MFEKEKAQMTKAGMKMDRYGLIALSGGNVSMRMPSGEILITPSGMIYEDMVPADVLVMDIDGNVIEGTRKTSSDTEGLLYIYKHREDINSVIHTHQPYATAVGLVEDEFEVNLTTLANACGGNVKVTPFSSAGSVDMGIDTVENLGDSLAVILANHGVMAVGENLKQALCAAVYLEEAAKTYLSAKAIGEPRKMTKEQVTQAVELFHFYGQGTPVIPKELVKRI
ncbi:MAG: class II aldolase/adducin family protein [Anaerostipes sp.]|nr:class II aldolase/adducin family protein [Anaerostipes sp.]